MQTVEVIDSHTGGEPTRIVLAGGPDLGSGPMAERLIRFQNEHDEFRSAVVNEPRGSDVMVGGLLCEPHAPDCVAGILFFNNVGTLGMCGHGTIGLLTTLHHLGRVDVGVHRIDTPVGPVTTEILSDGSVQIANVESYRHASEVELMVPGYGRVVGDVAYGGNWFFLVTEGPAEELLVRRHAHLSQVTQSIMQALEDQGIASPDGGRIDHVELFGPPLDPKNHSRNFVMCPGGAYDRSPCGTGTSAKLACLAADGKLGPGEVWRQESILGSVFTCTYQSAKRSGRIIPTLTGSAHISLVGTLLFDPKDPFRAGIRP